PRLMQPLEFLLPELFLIELRLSELAQIPCQHKEVFTRAATGSDDYGTQHRTAADHLILGNFSEQMPDILRQVLAKDRHPKNGGNILISRQAPIFSSSHKFSQNANIICCAAVSIAYLWHQ